MTDIEYSLNGQAITVPVDGKAVISFDKESKGRAGYSKKLKGKLKFSGKAFNILNSYEQSGNGCERLTLEMRQGGELIFSGFASGYNAAWDLVNCSAEVEIETKDRWVVFDDLKKMSINLFHKILPQDRVSVYTAPIQKPVDPDIVLEQIERDGRFEPDDTLAQQLKLLGYNICGGAESVSRGEPQYIYDPHQNDHVFYGCTTENSPTYTYKTFFSRWVKWVPESSEVQFGWIDLNEHNNGQKKLAKLPNLNPNDGTGYTENRECNTYSEWLYMVLDNQDTTPESYVVIDNGLLLKDVLTKLLLPVGLTPQSNFFNINATSPSAAVINPVTGTESTTANIIMFQKSDVKRYQAEFANATRFDISLDEILGWLVNMFNVQYDIIGTKMVIEHISHFRQTPITDLTTAPYDKFIEGKYKYSYTNANIPAEEVFSFMEASPGINDFTGVPIRYRSCGINKETSENHTVSKITTDILWVIKNGGRDADGRDTGVVSDNGFVMVSANKDVTGSYRVMVSNQIISAAAPRLNNVFGWAHLQNNFYKHGRFLPKGYMNDQLITFHSAIKTKKAAQIFIPMCDPNQFNPNTIIKTKLGLGEVESAEWNPKTKMLKLEILY